MEHVTDHVERAVARLLQQFRGKPRIEGLVSAHAAGIQKLEEAFWGIFTCDELQSAVGVQLDDLGELVGQVRGTLPDESYRVLIAARILVNLSSGTLPELEAILAQTIAAMNDNPFVLREDFPRTIVAVVLGAFEGATSYPRQLASIVRAARAGGVRSIVEWSIRGDLQTFRFAPSGDYPGKERLASGVGQGGATLVLEGNLNVDLYVGRPLHIDRSGVYGYGEVVHCSDADWDGDNTNLYLSDATIWGHSAGESVEPIAGDGFGRDPDEGGLTGVGVAEGAYDFPVISPSFDWGDGQHTIVIAPNTPLEEIHEGVIFVQNEEAYLQDPLWYDHDDGVPVRKVQDSTTGGHLATATE